MKLCVARRECGPARVPRSTLWTGVDRPQCEEVTSTDHSSHQGGENVTVVLTEEQKSMHNCAKWPRTILTTGISNKQWEGVVTPSPTLHLTESNPTPSSTPSPTCAFSTELGQCTVECDCISSPNYPGDYSASDHCVICVEQGTALHMLEFLTEQDYDLLWVSGQSYSFTEGLDGVEDEGHVEWTSDTQGTEKGWSICTDAPTPSPTSPISVVGMGDADDRCVSSPNFPENNGKLFFCSIGLSYDVLLLEDWVVDVRENPAAQSGWIHQVPDRWPCEAAYGCSLCSSIPARGAHERYVAAARVRAGSLESSEPFEVSAVDPHGTMFVDENGATLRGWIDSEDLKLWGPDARVQFAVGNAKVNIDSLCEEFQADRTGLHEVPFPCSVSLWCMPSGICTCSRDDTTSTGTGYFHVRLYCTGLGLQANIVEEYVLLSALLHIFAGLKKTRDQKLSSGLISGQLSLAITGLMLLMFITFHLFQLFLCCEAPSRLRRSSNRWYPGTGLGINDTKVSVPLRASTALQSAVSPCEQLISKSERHRSCE